MHTLATVLLLSCLSVLNVVGEVELYQIDFDEGTFLLTKSTEYRLMEDIIFNPNKAFDSYSAYASGGVLPHQFTHAGGKYDASAFNMGFFAAIAISADGATLNLNGFTISQSPEHALQQRFFSVIELADRPIFPYQSQNDFISSTTVAKNVIITNGTIGLSSQCGIRGNNVNNITISDIDIYDYEISAIAIHGGNFIHIENVNSVGSRLDVPVNELFATARYIRPYIDFLYNIDYSGTLSISETQLNISAIRRDLKIALENVHASLITETDSRRGVYLDKYHFSDEFTLFHNTHGISDKSSIAIDIHHSVPQHKIIDSQENILLVNVAIVDHVANMKEVISLSNVDSVPVVDPLGSVFQVFNKIPEKSTFISISSSDFNEAKYVGNAVANAQAFVGKAILHGAFENSHLDVSRSTFSQEIINWIENEKSSSLLDFISKNSPFCDIDAMGHVENGVVGLRISAIEDVRVRNIVVKNVTNFGVSGIKDTIGSVCCRMNRCQGLTSRGVALFGAVKARIEETRVENIISYGGSAYGIDILLDSHNIGVVGAFVNGIFAAEGETRRDFGECGKPVSVGYSSSEVSSGVLFAGCDSLGEIRNSVFGVTEVFVDRSVVRNELLSSESPFDYCSTRDMTPVSFDSLISLFIQYCGFSV
mmetsp:Transcript_4550/g.6822  ORF Transcript_4550/g.6822 Transcript_4550/m.6822 type:complete len:651 (+) Transcript_4550:419-2371(+)|eukprot:CAMPEP_0117019474 /NCGR_PEP_ID=MMETSP0472-20121206/14940_1 /TAXON_ID=693140 ORGANISM="Tiarina fusus, Strain LIS" /NCGR_SAMPLE_ID=MMETSP0472 /ASSEMBLY_ACC=CAM_ASM_000603 /LENGTH=650 /DNA_ID=CAMNT_0004724451 /DNA_START=2878 /DNA_END=4830 /DNA_ORIENTATION=+